MGYLSKRYNPDRTTVVFDGYDGPASTKSLEQRRRAAKKTSANLVVASEDFATTPKENFLGNNHNKSRLIKLLLPRLRQAGLTVDQAESDADALTIRTALKLAATGEIVSVVATDTDLLALLVGLTPSTSNVHLVIPGQKESQDRVHDISALQKKLGHAKDLILFVHAMTGCDTTSAFFGKEKASGLNLIMTNQDLAKQMKVFYDPEATRDEISSAGEAFILALYNGSKFKSLDEFRVIYYKRTVGRQSLDDKFDFRSLPPTSNAAIPQSHRVHLQVRTYTIK